MSKLILPRQYVQMAKPIVYWYNRKADFIMCPPSPIAPPPVGFERIECRHAHESDKWSKRLNAQAKRIHEMSEQERFDYEGKIQEGIIAEMERCMRSSNDPKNKQFMAFFLEKAKEKREKRRMEVIETYMHCEAHEGVAK